MKSPTLRFALLFLCPLLLAAQSLKDFETGLTLSTTFSATEREGNHSASIVEIQSDLTRKLLPVVVRAKDEKPK